MKLTTTKTIAENRRYVPPVFGNGDLSLQVDYTGSMIQNTYSGGMIPVICRAGIRYDSSEHELVPFGFFSGRNGRKVEDWSQTLDLDDFCSRSHCRFDDGCELDSVVFCHAKLPIIAVSWKQTGTESGLEFNYRWNARRVTTGFSEDGAIQYLIDTGHDLCGNIFLLSDKPVRKHSPERGLFCMTTNESESVFYIAFGETAKNAVNESGWNELFDSHRRAWSAYRAESRIPEGAGKISEVCRTAEYHLKISSTAWSVPIGIFPTHWQGRYFAFDEFFALGGLIASGHLSTAKKIVQYRASILENAKARAYSYFNQHAEYAKYLWECIEQPEIEGAPQGFWIEHIFHMAHIALETKAYCDAAHDDAFLKEHGYAVIRACAEFYRKAACIELGNGRVIIGKCTDLERLGPARENPFMTTCAAAATLRASAICARKLEIEPEMAEIWETLANRLLEALPNDGIKYIPYPGCEDSSIGLLSGIFPYAILPQNDVLQKNAVEHFSENENLYGNMYPVGKALCTWYACWKSIVLIRLGKTENARTILESTAAATGCFSEIFEIYENGSHPWFTTAEGIFLFAVDELIRATNQK